jgi:MoaA/NifB/PqqE/SkfB family radical SAM enzyme
MRLKRISLKIGNRCSNKCAYCIQRKKTSSSRNETTMPLQLIAKIFQSLQKSSFDEVHLTGGEISLSENVNHILNKVNDTGMGLSITTSGWYNKYLSPEKLFKNRQLKKAYVSIDSFEQNTHDKLRGKGSLVRALKTLETFLYLRDQSQSDIEINVVSVITCNNIQQIEEISEKLIDLKVNRWLPAYLEGVQFYPDLAPTLEQLTNLTNRREKNATLDNILDKSFNSKYISYAFISKGINTNITQSPKCSNLGNSVIINSNGDIFPCYGSEYYHIQPIGNIHSQDFLSWNNILSQNPTFPLYECRFCPEPFQNSINLMQ